MERYFCIFVTCFLVCGGSFAQSKQESADYAQRLRAAEQIVASPGSSADIVRRFAGMMAVNAMIEMMPTHTREANSHLTDEQYKRSVRLAIPVISQSTEKFASDGMRSMQINLAVAYAEKFTLTELMEIQAFQSGPLGRKLQEMTKLEVTNAMKPALEASQTMGKELSSGLTKVRQQLAQEGIVLK